MVGCSHDITSTAKVNVGFLIALAVIVVMLSISLVIPAADAEDTHAVEYDLAGGEGPVPESIEVAEGDHFTVDDCLAEKTGYIFDGWSDGTYTYMPGVDLVMGSHDITLFAVWVPITYTVQFDSNGGTGSAESIKVRYGVFFPNPSDSFSRLGHTASSWNTQRDGSGTAYPVTGNLSNLSTIDGDTVTLFIQWTPNEYEVRYSSEHSSEKYSDKVVYGEPYTMKGAIFEYLGHTQTGWVAEDGTKYALSEKFAKWDLTEDLDLKAVWEVDIHTIRFSSNGGEGSMYPLTAEYGATVRLPICGFYRDGCEFTGWNTEADGSGTAYEDRAYYKVEGDATLFAQWDNVFLLIYDSNGGYGGPSAQTVITHDDSVRIKVSAVKPTLSGYELLGWSESPTALLPEYIAGDEVDLTIGAQTVRLYAVWSISVTFSVTYIANGGTDAPEKQTVQSQAKSVQITVSDSKPKRSGYEFKGWSESTDGSDPIKPGETITVMSSEPDKVLFAIWSGSSVVPVTSIEIVSPPKWVDVGDTAHLIADILPENSTVRTPVWTVSDESLAVISSNGQIKGLNVGTVTVTATADGVSASCRINISALIEPIVTDEGESAVVINTDDVTQSIERAKDEGKPIDLVVVTDKDSIEIEDKIIDALRETPNSSLTVTTSAGTVKLSSDALQGISDPESSVEFLVKKVDLKEKYPDLEHALGLQATIAVDKAEKPTVFGEAVKVSIDYQLADDEDPAKMHVYYVRSETDIELMEDAYYEDGKIWFSTTHFSDYIVTFDKDKSGMVIWPWLIVALILLGIGLACYLHYSNSEGRGRNKNPASQGLWEKVSDYAVVYAGRFRRSGQKKLKP